MANSALPAISRVLEHKDDAVRVKALSAYWRVSFGADAGNVVDGLAALLKSPQPSVRVTAARTLGEIGGKAKPAVPALAAALSSPDDETAAAALEAMKQITRSEQ